MKRTLLATTLALLLVLPQPAWAQGQGNGGGNGNGNGQGQSENAGGGNSGNGIGLGLDKADPLGKSNENAVASPPRELSESDALAAVETGRAVELETILPDLRSRTGGEVINAQLQQVGAFLIYAVTVLTPSGQVLTEHYYARSGVPVGK